MLCPVQGDLEGHGRLPPTLGESLVPIATGDRPRDSWVEPAWGELSLKRGAQEPVGAEERCSTQSGRPRKLLEGGHLHYISVKAGTGLPPSTWDNMGSLDPQQYGME